jgi:hypothetical protein
MNHLGQRLSALIDDELGDTEREQVHAHLVDCSACRAEAATLRMLKRRMRDLSETPADSDLTKRLIALGGLAEPVVPRSRPAAGTRARAALAAFSGGPVTGAAPWHDIESWLGQPVGTDPEDSPQAGPSEQGGRGRGHGRFMVVGAVAALAVSLGTVSFAAGGDHSTGPTVTPEVDLYSAAQAVMTGEVPMPTPHAFLSARISPRQTGVAARP